MGVTTGGSIGAKSSKTLDDCVTRIQGIADAARGVNPDVLVICHGGPISEPPDAEYIITHCRGVDGFYGASSVERLPAERAIAEQIRTFKKIRLPAIAGRRSGARRGSAGQRDERQQADDEPRRGRGAPVRHRSKARVELAPWGKHWWLSKPGLTGHEGSSRSCASRCGPAPATSSTTIPAREEIIYIVDGVAEQWVDREKRRLKAGRDAPSFPKNVVHAIHNPSSKPMTFLAILSPAEATGPFLVDCYDDEPWRSLRKPFAYRAVDPRTGRATKEPSRRVSRGKEAMTAERHQASRRPCCNQRVRVSRPRAPPSSRARDGIGRDTRTPRQLQTMSAPSIVISCSTPACDVLANR